MLGVIIVWVSFLGAAFGVFSYYRGTNGNTSDLNRARKSYVISVAGIVAASVLLMLYILRHQFEYEYIWSYSSRDLPLELLITTFWAGQEGSFLFWALCTALIGLFLQHFSRKRGIEGETMAVYAFLQAFLLLLMVVKSPFEYVWNAFPKEVAVGNVPADGRGLNPLLQNFWMIIHPPVLFVGFAAMGVPFALAVGALWKKAYREWISHALPWVLFGALSLGAGLMFGGYWAYGVLGWGGWWGWDPVENSSLIPWIVGVALLHTMIVQKKTGKLARMNFALAILAFVFVVYSTFLTRSGILGEASVHSFTDPGAVAYTLLVVWILSIIGLGFVMLARRWSDLKKLGEGVGTITRESLITVGVLALAASALIILFGTSLPIVSKLTVEPSFYDSTNLPIAILMGLLIGLSLLVQYRMESWQGLLRRALLAAVLSAVSLAGLIVIGLHDPAMAGLAFTSLFAFYVCVRHGYRLAKEQPMLVGGALSHIGVAILFLAIIGSGFYGKKLTVSLPQNESKEVLNYRLTYKGAQRDKDEKWRFVVEAEQGTNTFTLAPVMYHSTFNNSTMRIPDYTSFLTRDFYLEPVSVEEGTGGAHVHDVFDLTKGEPVTIGDMQVTFVRFDMTPHGTEAGAMGGSTFPVGAVLEVVRGKKKEVLTPVTIYKQDDEREIRGVKLKGSPYEFQVQEITVGMEGRPSAVRIKIAGFDTGDHDHEEEARPETLVVEASLKPFMIFIWIAALLASGGLFIAMIHRNREMRT
ncbi:MAG: hypothetical protein FJ215_08505 [Ignavibacteria bacterium]|nr:hypothetical protein [Ignavibacteria bacterium]